MRTGTKIFCVLIFLVIFFFSSPVACETEVAVTSADAATLPNNMTVSVQLNQEGKYITAIFRGGMGQSLLKSIQVEVIHSDGSKDSEVLRNIVGDSVVIEGSGCGDQVTATAFFKNGQSYQILDEQMYYIRGICPADFTPYLDPCAKIAASPYLKPSPVEEIPANKSVFIQANVDLRFIEVQFRGGFGQNLIKTIDVTRIGPDGSNETQILGNRVGDELIFPSTNGCLDRITANVSFIDGTRYHFFDEILHISRYH